MTSPVRTENLKKTYEVRARKGLFKSKKARSASNTARKHGSLSTY